MGNNHNHNPCGRFQGALLGKLDDGDFDVRTGNVSPAKSSRLKHWTDDMKQCDHIFEDVIEVIKLEDGEAGYQSDGLQS